MAKQEDWQTVWWEAGMVCLIDQRLLPHRSVIVYCKTLKDVAFAIKAMQVRGAPAIGCTAAYGMALAAYNRMTLAAHSKTADLAALLTDLEEARTMLNAQRPTAINLSWATARMLHVAQRLIAAAGGGEVDWYTAEQVTDALLEEAHTILAEDLAMCHAIGKHGMPLIPERGHVLTHCNAGGLATAGYGTALAPLRAATEQGRHVHVYVDETRPYLQGARLTTWELQRAAIDQTLIPDNMAGYLMRQGEIDCVLVGADRIVANGDVANKIGTYALAVLARVHKLPFYVAAPSSTIDLSLTSGDDIPLVERAASAVTHLGSTQLAPEGVVAAHPAFDITPHELISAIITEKGVIYPPYTETLLRHVPGGAENRQTANQE